MEPHTPHPLPAGPTQEQDSTPEEVSSTHEREVAGGAQTVSDRRTIDRFPPTDEAGIMDCLNRKVNNQLVECGISDANVYEQTPEELAGNNPSLGNDEWWFFSPRYRKSLTVSAAKRDAGTGYWCSEDARKLINDLNGVCIGYRKRLSFYEGKRPKGKRTIWRMIEYVPDKPPRESSGHDDVLLDECVLCKIYKGSLRPPKVAQKKITNDAAQSCKAEDDTNQEQNIINTLPNQNLDQEQNIITLPDQNFDDQQEQNIITLPDQDSDDQQEQNIITLPDQNSDDQQEQNIFTLPDQNFIYQQEQEQNIFTLPDQNFDDQRNIITLPDQNFDDQRSIVTLPDQNSGDFDPDEWKDYLD